jgi:hypothetical protein
MSEYVQVWKAKVGQAPAASWDELRGRFPELLDAG